MGETVELAIVGAGSAGLSLSHELMSANIDHVVLERGKVGQTWRKRWDNFCLIIPNWTIRMPGGNYTGDDPDGFMPRDDIVSHLDAYAGSFRAPVREGVSVSRVGAGLDGGFRLLTDAGEIHARQVVMACGGFQKPFLPLAVQQFPASVHLVDTEGYTSPGALPPGPVLVVGSGQTGCQLAEELRLAGRTVYLACGRAGWFPRRLDGIDTLKWIVQTSFMDVTVNDLPSPAARNLANPQMSGQAGGHDLNYRTLQAMGVQLTGRLEGVQDGIVHFAGDLAESVAFGDARYADIRALITKSATERGVAVPQMPVAPPFVADPPLSLPLASLAAVVSTTGFRPDYAGWVDFPDALDAMGYPLQQDGTSTVVEGLHFMGVHFQRKRQSATLWGVGEDATVLAERIVAGSRKQAAL
jgi:putative flavoprotein involved in K+ transport